MHEALSISERLARLVMQSCVHRAHILMQALCAYTCVLVRVCVCACVRVHVCEDQQIHTPTLTNRTFTQPTTPHTKHTRIQVRRHT